MRKQQIKNAIRNLRIAYKKQWPASRLVSILLHGYWLKYEGGTKPDDVPF